MVSKYDALNATNLPLHYQAWFAEEEHLVTTLPQRQNILDAGCGEGRIAAIVAPTANTYLGIDNDNTMVERTIETLRQHPTAAARHADIQTERFGKQFDLTLCLGNTLGCVENDHKAALNLAAHSNSLVISVIRKGTMTLRKEYYKALKIDDAHYDDINEVIYTSVWGRSRAYTLHELTQMVGAKHYVTATYAVGELGLWVQFTRKQ